MMPIPSTTVSIRSPILCSSANTAAIWAEWKRCTGARQEHRMLPELVAVEDLPHTRAERTIL
jgi:hypothetical protein